jgi:hypothetical protein
MNCCLMTAGKYAGGEGRAAAAGELWLLAKNLPCLSDDVRRQPGWQEMTMRHPAGMKKSASHPRARSDRIARIQTRSGIAQGKNLCYNITCSL